MKLQHLLLVAAITTLAVRAFAAEPYRLEKSEIVTLAAKAPAALTAPIVTVVDKPQASPTGDAHDYVSFARYTWPDPSKPDGLPYITIDGKHNEELVARGDHEHLFSFVGNVSALAAAWQVNYDEAAARRAGEWLRAWFITPATRMNPNMEFAQIRLGHNNNHGNPTGVLDSRGFSNIVDALLLLQGSPALTAAEETTVRAWFGNYLDWLTTAKIAISEHANKNNHGSWFLAQIIPIARYAGRVDLARELCEEDKVRIADQFQPDGSQPLEIRREDGLGYSLFNLDAQFQIARHATGLGIDLWNYTSPTGASLRQGLKFLQPYNVKPETWPTKQNAKLRPGFLDSLLAQAHAVWPDFDTAPKK